MSSLTERRDLRQQEVQTLIAQYNEAQQQINGLVEMIKAKSGAIAELNELIAAEQAPATEKAPATEEVEAEGENCPA